MILSHRIAIDPTVEQRIALARACGVARFTWNWALAEWTRQYEAGDKPTAQALKKKWNAVKGKEFPWVYDSPKDANHQPFANLDDAFRRFFKGAAGRPGFKRRGEHDSFYVSNDRVRIEGYAARLPVIGTVRLTETLRLTGKIMSAVVSRTADRWFLSVAVEVPDRTLPEVDKTIGIDLGLKIAVACSDGTSAAAPKPLRQYIKKVRRVARQRSRRQTGSNNQKKSARRLARLHARVANIRRDWLHKITSRLVHENQVLCVEDLNVTGMMANRSLARAISDVGWREFRRQLEYKTRLYGRKLQVVGRFMPSTKVCSNCGCKKDAIALSERVFRCTDCGFEIDRDLNAARNIRTLGLRGINACGPEGSGLPTRMGRGTKPCRVEAGTRPGGHVCALFT